jgi:hypothetical protein
MPSEPLAKSSMRAGRASGLALSNIFIPLATTHKKLKNLKKETMLQSAICLLICLAKEKSSF